MRTGALLLALALSLPLSTSCAQRGGIGGRIGGMGRRGGAGRAGGDGAPVEALNFPSAAELQRYNPAQLLLDRREDLVLTADQTVPLTNLKPKIDQRNADLYARYDSVQKTYHAPTLDRSRLQNRGSGRQQPDSATADGLAKMRRMRLLLDTLETRRILDVSESVAIMSGDLQKQRASEFIAQQEKDLRAKLPVAGRGAGRRGG